MKKALWITYDLGIKGDYTGMYSWLDDNDAIECGNNVAFIKEKDYNCNDDITYKKNLLNEIEKAVDLKESDRIYIVYNSEQKSTKGAFIKGKRKSNPWKGYGTKNIIQTEDE